MLFKALAEFAEKQALDSSNVGLFGEPEPVSVKDALNMHNKCLVMISLVCKCTIHWLIPAVQVALK